jgi:two-component system response regulator CiaR
MAIKLLLVEDDLALSNSVYDYLESFADVTQVFDGDEGFYEAETGVYDLIILDLMLPERNGIDVLRDLRARNITTPVLITTAKGALEDKMQGFDFGADDYLTKPFYLDELKARIMALLKRTGKLEDSATLTYGNLTVNVQANSVTVDGQPVEILGKEFELLVYLIQNQNIILNKEKIFDRIWGIDSDTTLTVVEVYMSKLRKKLKGTDFEKNLATLRNVGYILR